MAVPTDVRPFIATGNTATISATSASAATSVFAPRIGNPEIPQTYRVYNAGPGLCWVTAGVSADTIVASATVAVPVPIGNTEVFQAPASATHAITLSASSSTVYVTPGQGA